MRNNNLKNKIASSAMSAILSVGIAASSFAAMPVSAAAFSDLTAEHWAYENIMQLANDGTINGYSDGTFLPEGTVTRAEFVKMIGKSDVLRDVAFDDIDASHWCYEYIMYSGLDAYSDNIFAPDTPILRADVANLLYKRYAKGDAAAPYSISSQGSNPKATAWVYSYGLMMGDDKVNLRLGDTLTRAEAATLIVRARNLDLNKNHDFINNFSDEVYETVYNSSNLFDTPYDANGEISYGELSTAALRLRFRDRTLSLGHYYYDKKYEGDYAAEWDIMCNYVLPKDKYKSSQAESTASATVAEALAMITHGAMNVGETKIALPEGSGMYADVALNEKDVEYSKHMQYAHNFGITLYANDTLNANDKITKKQLACILMQYDLAVGINVQYNFEKEDEVIVSAPILTELGAYPSNASDYAVILAGVPKEIYEAPFKGENVSKCRDMTSLANSLESVFEIPLSSMSVVADSIGIDMKITYYTSLMAMNDNGFLYRLKVKFNSPQAIKMSDIFNLAEGVADENIVNGKEYWIDLATNAKLSGLYIDYSIMTLEQVLN